MTERVFLHIGLLKTATTFLQDGLWAHKEELGRRGLLVPGRHRRRHLIASLDLREDPKLARRSGDVAHPWQDLVDEVRAWAGGTAVISHEFFAPATEDHIRRAVESLADVELHVVITARVLTELAPSLWQEWVKNGGQRAIDSFLAPRDPDPHDEWGWSAYDLADVLRRWGSVVPSERVHVLPMRVDHTRREEIWERFLTLLEVSPLHLAAPEEAANVSLGVVEVEALRRINAELVDFNSAGDRSHWIRSYLAHSGVMPNSRERFRPGPERWAELVARAQEAVRLLEASAYDVRGDLDALRPPVELPELRHPDDVADAELLHVSTQTIAAMLTDVRSRNRAYKALQQELEVVNAQPPRVGFPKILFGRGKGPS
ncbi:hypothetical protein [Nocardioides daejeonensis]|uniref:hypothetical protein n=1 Tax=Nocardioides daejeonensis TaxID=1046556 RepID=UPI000D747677|nr:hypothetical protein [Nocardioides daejeonensis]